MQQSTYPLWLDPAPAALGSRPEDIPSVSIYPPDPHRKNGAAILVFAGGNWEVRVDHEGPVYAEWLASQGYACFLINYRLTPHGYPISVITQDALRAVRWVRAHAAEYAIDPAKIGVIGSSAGGHICGHLAVHGDAGDPQSADPIERASSRPDLAVLCYPVTVLQRSYDWSYIFGHTPTVEELHFYSPALNVTPKSSPCFMLHTWEDTVVPIANSLRLVAALKKKKVPCELHLYEHGAHGIGLANGHPWTLECLRWLAERFNS
jgi:acetyl esterase/lipase